MAASIVGLDSLSENRTPSKKSKRLHLFGTILTYASPSSNHHGKGDETESPLQTITKQGRDYPIISPYAIRSALREILIVEELPSNRWRSLPEVIANQ
jgi:CRISPR-associated protein Cst2